MTATMPLVSVIIPVYNGDRFLRDAIDSIRAHSYWPLEIIVVDDGSTDATRAVASHRAGEVQYVHQENAGTPAARKTGLRMAQGTLIDSSMPTTCGRTASWRAKSRG